jgi:hypothetical protein
MFQVDEWIGYPQLATFQTTTSDFSVYRGFHYLHARVLLELQDEVAVLERELDYRDREDIEGNRARQRTLRSRAMDTREAKKQQGARTRRDILKDIRTKLSDYGKLNHIPIISRPGD